VRHFTKHKCKMLKRKRTYRQPLIKRGVDVPEEIPYEVFKEKIINLLTEHSTGITWSKIAQVLDLPQAVPNNKWVRRLESETGLRREKDGSDTFWFLQSKGLVYTIGYEGKSITQFIDRLKLMNIEQLIDVREIALSRKNGFAKNSLRKALTDNGIVYKHLPELGSPSDIRHKLKEEWDYVSFFKDYAKSLERPKSQTGLIELENLAHMRKSVIMCFEYSVERCHRKILKENLIAKGFGVVDL
jgi:hypothetical protein